MIQIYQRGNTDYTKNGDTVLFPTECNLRAKLNGVWEMKLEHPVDEDGRWKHIAEESVIAAPTFMGEKQLFRIDKVNKDDTEVTVVAYPIFFDAANDCFLLDVRPTSQTGQGALNIMTAGSKYSGRSDITSVDTAYFVRRNLMSAINGEEEPSFVGRWGGEILYDNHTVIINERVGGNYGVEIRYGKNMSGIDYQVDMADVVTRIVPVAYNGYTLDGASPWVDSPNVNKYAKIYTKEVKFDDVKLKEDASDDEESYETLSKLRAELRKRCNELYSNGADLPKVTIKIDMIDLSGSDEYAEYEDIEKIGLGDTVKCYNSRLDITTEARAIEIEWDCIRDVVGEVVLGDFEYNYFSEVSSALDSLTGRVNSAVRGDGSVVASVVKGFLDATKTQLRLQNTVAKKQDVRAIQFEDLDPESELFGAMSLGTQGLQIAKRRTADNRDWGWTTALTANGLIANIIVTGILSDKKGLNSWNLDTGEMNMHVMSIVADEFSLSSGKTIEDIASGVVDDQTQVDILNKLTNNGKDDGIYLLNGKLYISFNAARGGTLTLGGANNVNGKIVMLGGDGGQYGSWTNEGLAAIGDLELRKYFSGKNRYFEVKLDKFDNIHRNGNVYSMYGLRIGTDVRNSVSGYGEVLILPWNGVADSNPRETMIYSNTGLHIVAYKYPETQSTPSESALHMEGSSIRLVADNKTLLSYESRYKYGITFPQGILIEDNSAFHNPGTTTSGTSAQFEYAGTTGYYQLKRQSSSSCRYKDVRRKMSEKDVESLYGICPVIAKYKKEYLSDKDERYEMEYPMFIAEDVDKYFPEATDHNSDGTAENWNHRVLIPAMFQMIKSQKETVDSLTERIEKLEKILLKDGGRI